MISSINNSDTTTTTNTAKPTRPYTEYNIYFQLEREYILQILLDVEPAYEADEIFHPSQPDYRGPLLPSRYAELVLPNDWFVPGKEKRRKRRHRKSHGAIGFHELSLKIAEAWKSVDEETGNFCAVLSDIGMLKYKSAMRKYKLTAAGQEEQEVANKEKAAKKSTKKSEAVKKSAKSASKTAKKAAKKTLLKKISKDSSEKVSAEAAATSSKAEPVPRHVSYSEAENVNAMDMEHVPFALASTNQVQTKATIQPDNVATTFDAETDLCISYYFSENPDVISSSAACTNINSTNATNSPALVDMGDDEILSIWESTPVSNNSEPAFFENNAKPVQSSTFSLDDVEQMRQILAKQQFQLQRVAQLRNFVPCLAA